MHTRTPITDANIAAQDASVMARIASGQLSRQAMAERPYSGARTRNIKAEMKAYLLERGTVTEGELQARFTQAHITRWFPEARDEANQAMAGAH